MTNEERKNLIMLLEKRKEELQAEHERLTYNVRQSIFTLRLVLPDDQYNEVIEEIRSRLKTECPEALEKFNSYVI